MRAERKIYSGGSDACLHPSRLIDNPISFLILTFIKGTSEKVFLPFPALQFHVFTKKRIYRAIAIV